MWRFILSFILLAGLNPILCAQDQALPPPPPASPTTGSSSAGRGEVQKGGLIQGKVIDADTAAGLRKTTLILRRLESQTEDKPVTTHTDQNGYYRFDNIKPGRYTLTASRNGYVRQVYGQKGADSFSPTTGIALDVKTGETLQSINFRLIRGGAVEGRILDADNEPVANVWVRLMKYGAIRGSRQLFAAGMANTDDRGHYRIFNVAPGRYFLSASYRARESPEENISYSQTYYPGVLTPEEASSIQVSSGRELTGIDLILAETAIYIVSGTVIGSEGKPVLNAWVRLKRIPTIEMSPVMGEDNLTDSQGIFRLKNILPGKYRLLASTTTQGEGKQQTGSTQLEVTNTDVEGIVISLGEGAEIAGRVILGGKLDELSIRRLSVSLNIDPELGWGAEAEISKDLTFRLVNLPEMEGRFQVFGIKENAFVKSIRMDGREVLDQVVEIKGSGRIEGVEIVISPEGASVRGVVCQEENGPVVKGATVIIFPADIEKRFPNSRFIKTAQTDQQGEYSLRGLPPSEYFISALKKHEAGLESDENFLKGLEKVAITVKLSASEDKTASLIAIDPPESE